MTTSGAEWAPTSCTLPAAERPLRAAEFDALFKVAARQVDRVTATHARVLLAGTEEIRVQAAELTARETECCSFFAFTLAPAGPADPGDWWLEIEVPAAQMAVLDGLVARASMLVETA
jgi:hypothetical protein